MRPHHGGWAYGLAASLVVVAAARSFAEDGVQSEREKQLEKRVEELEKVVEKLAQQTSDGSSRSSDNLAQSVDELEKLTKKDKDGLFGYFKNGVRMDSANGAFKIKVGGFFQNDWNVFWGNHNVEKATSTQVEAGTEFRRARLAMGGTIYKNVDFNAEYDFAGGAVGFRNVWLGTRLGAVGYLQVGSMKEPFGLEELTPDLFVTFPERSSGSEAFSPAYNTGFMLSDACCDDRVNWAFGAFRDANGAGNDVGNSRSGEMNYTARVSGRPWVGENDNEFLHVGTAFSKRCPSNNTMMFSAHPELHLAPLTVNTKGFATNRVNLWEAEAAFVFGEFSAQAELYRAWTSGTGTSSDSEFGAWAMQATWFLTGESRGYNAKKGVFDRVIPKDNYGDDAWGAWELAARLDGINLNEGPIDGGAMRNLTLGVNWYLNPNTKVSAAFVHSHIADVGHLHGFEMRFQVDF